MQTQKTFSFSAEELQSILSQFIQAAFPAQQEEHTEQQKTVPVMLTIKEAAERFHCSEYAIRSLIRKRQVPCVRLGARILLDQDTLINFFRGGSRNV